MTAANRVTLYRVRRPDGTVIEAPAHSIKAHAVRLAQRANSDLRAIRQRDGYRGCQSGSLGNLAAQAGYAIEPVEFAEMPSEETRKAVHSALIQLDYDAQRNPLSRQFNPAAALSELERIWGK